MISRFSTLRLLSSVSRSMPMMSVANQLFQVKAKLNAAAKRRPEHLQHAEPRLVAVSKTKGTDMIVEAYDAGQRHFGENYVMELHEKAEDIEILDHCTEIKWHFIGHLQRNKVSKLLEVPNLYVVETVDTERLAKAVNDTWSRLKKTTPLNVMVQCNTSGEKNKNGCSVDEASKLSQYINEQCSSLSLMGLMTIGSFDHDLSKGPNPDFQALFQAREQVCETLNLSTKDLELSMGMSADFEHAIESGSTSVRVGSTIFGKRDKPAAMSNGASSQGNEANSVTDSTAEKLSSLTVS